MVTGSLFNDFPAFDRDGFIQRLARLKRDGILVGGSSWKYEGWLNQIYTPGRYLWRGRFSKRLFEQECLREYAEVFPVVCGDFAFYQFPGDEWWRRLFAQTPPGFQFAFKVPEQITCHTFPQHPRYAAQGGLPNPTFLDPVLLHEGFLRALLPYREKVAALIFEFGTFSSNAFPDVSSFLELLAPFLRSLPPEFRYAVEIRNSGFLTPGYFACLRERGVAHVYNAWTRMPELPSQIALPGSRTADFLLCRALLRQGRSYEEAVARFSPYSEVQEVNEATRAGLRELIGIGRSEGKTTFLFINNRLEGNAPGTIVSITDDILGLPKDP